MTEGFDRDEDELQHRQGSALYPVGRSLRTTFPLRDNEELQPRITSLMVELSHQPYEPVTMKPVQQPAPGQPPSMVQQLARFFGWTAK